MTSEEPTMTLPHDLLLQGTLLISKCLLSIYNTYQSKLLNYRLIRSLIPFQEGYVKVSLCFKPKSSSNLILSSISILRLSFSRSPIARLDYGHLE